MKKITFTIVFTIFLITLSFAQSDPQGMQYQAVARDLSGNIMVNKQVSLQVSLQSNIQTHEIYYTEIHVATTNQFGLFSLVIGEGQSINGTFSKIPWSSEEIWMEISIKDNETSNFKVISNSKLLAVPYAFHANTATKINSLSESENVSWLTTGNAFRESGKYFLGTTKNVDLVLKQNDIERFKLSSDGQLGIISATGDFRVQGSSLLKGTLSVSDLTNLQQLNVSKSAVIERELKVNQNTELEGNLKVNENTRLKGQVTINVPELEGFQGEMASHPLIVKGSNQGIAISVNRERPGIGSNFITFFDANEGAVGRIEGSNGRVKEKALDILKAIFDGEPGINILENLDDIDATYYDFNDGPALFQLRNTYFKNEYARGLIALYQDIFRNSMNLIITLTSASVTACVQDCDDPIIYFFDIFFNIKDIQRYKRQFILNGDWQNGVAFESGGADYAEWLKKADPDEHISIGEVVGIKNGLISKSFTDADQFMAITSNPIIVGAMPKNGAETAYKKVALMGQVPILVYGKAENGDYILPSGFGDGTAIAINPNKMKATDYAKIIGVAWSSSKNENTMNYINTAVGFNTNQMGMMINNMQTVMNSMQEELAKLNPNYKPIYFDTEEVQPNYSLSEFLESEKAAEPCNCIGAGFNLFKCRIICWLNRSNNANLITNQNIIRSIAERPLNGEVYGIIAKKIKDMISEVGDDKIQPIIDDLFELIDIETFDDFPEIQSIVQAIKDGELFQLPPDPNGPLGEGFLQDQIEKIKNSAIIFKNLITED